MPIGANCSDGHASYDPDCPGCVDGKKSLALATDVDDMMCVLRCVASLEYTREEVREQARAALERLKVRGI